MASKKQSALSRTNNARRLNDLVLGHVGRVSYMPRQDSDNENDGGPGKLYINRIVHDVPSFQEVNPFEEWYSPSQTPVPLNCPTGFRAQRSQQYYLLREHPEAFLGLAADLKSTLQEDAALWRAESKHSTSARTRSLLPLVAIGEITDRTARGEACPVLAVVCGDSGDVVRLVRLHEERQFWGGEGDEDASVLLKMPDSGYEGFWHSEGLVILKLQLVSFPKRGNGMRRWLLVQTATATHVFEPEVLKVPTWNKFNGHATEAFSGPAYISMSLILSIKSQGCQNADFMFDPGDGERIPRLAVVDMDGYWNVWDIQPSERQRRHDTKATVSLRSSGHVHDDAFEDLGGHHNLCRIAWAAPLRDTGWQPHHTDDQQYRALVVGTWKTLVVFDMTKNSPDYPQITLAWLVDPIRAESILDIAICPEDPSKIFVLTNTTVFWLELRLSYEDSEPFRVVVLISCPHQRSPIDNTLRMSITRPTRDGQWLVCIFSGAGSSRTTFFWFHSPHYRSEIASFCHQVANLSLIDDARYIHSIALTPNTLVMPRKASTNIPHKSHFAQLVVLTRNFGLHSALFAVTIAPSPYHRTPRITAPKARGVADVRYRSVNFKRKMIASQLRNAFVVRDDYTALLEHGRRYKTQPEAKNSNDEYSAQPSELKQDPVAKGYFLDLEPVMQIVMQRVAARVSEVCIEGLDAEDVSVSNAFAVIRQLVEIGLSEAHLPMTTFLEADTQLNSGCLISCTGSQRWVKELAQLQELAAEDDNFQVNDLTGGMFTFTDPITTFDGLLHLWTSSLPKGLLNEKQARQRKALIAFIATDVSQAQIGVSVAPRPPAPKDIEALSQKTGKSSSLPDLGPMSPLVTPSLSRASSEVRSFHSMQASSVSGFEESEQQQDPAAMRLARYATSIGYVPVKKEESALLAHWPAEPGSDPADFSWSWARGEERRLAERLEAARRAKEARRLRMTERRVAMGLSRGPEDTIIVDGSTQAPRIAPSSQAAVGGAMPQTQTQILSSQPVSQDGVAMSQPVLGKYDGRSASGKKKVGKGRKFGFR